MALIFHYRPQESLLGKANPLIKLLLLIAFCIVVSTAPLATTGAMLGLLVLTMLLIRLPLLSYGRDLRFFLIMGSLILLANGLSTRDWTLAWNLTLRFLAVILAAIIFSDTTDFWDLSCAIAPLIDWIPFVHGWRIASAIQLTIMLVPMVFDATNAVRDAQRSRCGFKGNPVKALITYAWSVMDTLLEMLDDVSDSLDARLFDPDVKRERPPIKLVDVVLCLGGVALLAMIRYLC